MSGKLGLFLGAGASYELGMPLVWDLTKEFKRYYTPEKLRSINRDKLAKGFGYEPKVIEEFIEILQLENTHYESLLGNLENKFKKREKQSDAYYGLYCEFVESIYFLLLERHLSNAKYIESNLKFFEGFKALVDRNSPLWVFSLNHDLMVECLSAHLGIPLSCGFSTDKVLLPRRSFDGKIIGHLQAETLEGTLLDSGKMNFFDPASRGINLLKIHGALDVFTYQNGKDLLKILPLENTVQGYLESLRILNEELISPEWAAAGIRSTNEIAYWDDNNVTQFLRRTLLSGAFKFSEQMSQVLPKALLKHFRSNLAHVDRLVCIGYGFNDSHINKVIRDWIEADEKRNLEIVNPGFTFIPSDFQHIPFQVTLIKSTMSDYLDKAANIVRPEKDILLKEVAAEGRKNQFLGASKREFEEFSRDLLKSKIQMAAKKLEALPRTESGAIDFAAAGITLEQLREQASAELKMTEEEIIGKYLEYRKSKK